MSLKFYFDRTLFLLRVGGFFLLGGLLLLNQPAAAQNYLLRYVNTASGAVTFTGNTLGLAKQSGQNQPGTLDSIGTFITLNTNFQVGTYPKGTTLNWSNDSSAAVLRIPTNSTVLYAELIWSGTAQIATDTSATGDVRAYINTPVKFILPDGSTNSVTPDPATANFVTNGSSAIFYVRSANVTALVQAAGAGTYAAGGVPGTVLAAEDSNNSLGWTLAVVYGNSLLHQRNLSLFVGNSFAISGGTPPNPAAVTGFCAPSTGAVNARLFVSAVEGDSSKTGDQMLFGPTTNTLAQLSGPNNLANNFFASQINGDNGLLDTSGTFGLSNSVPPNVAFSARQGWDITSVDVSSGLTNGITSAYAQNITQGDGYMVNALALQIDVGSPVLNTTQTVDKASTFVGDTLTYTVTVTNSGTADAVNLIFTDPLPFGTSFITNTFATNGVVIAGANPVNGVPISIIKQNSSYTVAYQVLVNQIPPSAKFITAATINFQYAGACAQSPIVNGTLVNADVQTLVPLLNINKVASLTNVIPGAAMTYTINVPNVGTTNTVGSTLLDPLPTGVSYITNTTTLNGVAIPDIGTNMPYTVATEIHGPASPAGQINVGDTAVVAFQVLISTNPPIRINNTATIYADGIHPTTAQNAAANISPVYSDLAVGISGSPNPVAAGANISYTVSVTNNGPNSVNDVTNYLTLSLPLPSSILSPVYAPTSGSYNPLTGVWSGINLPSNGIVTMTISGEISPDVATSNLVSSVTVTPPVGVTDLVTNNNSAAATNVIVQIADLAVTISDGVTNVHQGDALTYTVTAINLGPSTLTSINVSNSISPFLTGIAYAPVQGNFNSANGVWNGLALAAGDSVTLTITATVSHSVAGLFTNFVAVSVPSGVTDPVLTNNSAADIDTVFATPDLTVVKNGPANVFAGTNFNYTISVTNVGLATASNAVVSDVLPTNVVFVSASGNGNTNAGTVNWNLGNLGVNAVSNLTLTVTAPTSGSITNVASVAASTPDSNLGNNTSPPVGTGVTPLADLAVGKSGPVSVTASSNYTYSVSITNFGPSSASSVVVTDTLPAGVTFVSASGGGANGGGSVHWSLGALVSGQTSNLTLTVKAPASGSITNTANVNSPTLDPNSGNNTSPQVISTVTTLALSADIRVTKAGPANVFAETNFNYTITVTNAGPNIASNVVASDVLPTNIVFVSASGGGTTNAGVASWAVGNLAAGVTTNLVLTMTAPASGTITNIATVTSPTADPTPGNNTSSPVGTSVIPLADVAVTGSGPTNVLAGGTILYTVTVTNFGPSTASNVVVSDSLPPGVSFTGATGGGTNNSGVVTWPAIPGLTNGQSYSFTVTVTAPASGTLTNTVSSASPTADPILGNNNGTDPSAITITAVTPVADLAVGKSGSAASFLGGNFSYTISVTNFGPSTATALSVTDNLPAGINFVSAIPSATTNGNQVVWANVTNLVSNGITNLTLNVTAVSRGSVTNLASAGSPTLDPNSTNNLSAPVITAVTNRPPVAANDSATTSENVAVTVPVLNNDSDPDGDMLTIISLNPTNGTANIVGTNVVFTPATNFVGTATIGYTISDGFGGTSTALVSVSVTNIPPVANPDSYSVSENSTNTLSPLVNDVVNTLGGSLTIISVNPTNGSANISGTNVVFRPTTNFLGTATIGYTIIDNVGGTNFGLITVSVTNRPPVAVNDLAATAINTAVSIPVLANDSDPDGNPLSIVSVSPTNGAANIVGTNIVFTPSTNFIGTGYVLYSITDGNGGTNSAVVTITVTNSISAPTANGQSLSTPENTALAITLTGSDPNSRPLTYIIVTSPAHGTLTLLNTNTGAVTYTPGTNYTGADSFTFRVNNGLTNSAIATVSLTVLSVADLSVTQSGPASGIAGSNLVFTVTVTNRGPAAATNIVVTNNLAAGFTFVSASAAGTVTNNFVIWTIPSLALNGKTNLTVTAFAAEGGSLTNIASGISSALDLNLTNNNGSLTNAQTRTLISALADVAVIKTGGTNVYGGGTVNYTVTVTNAGPSTATNVVVKDNLPTNVVFQNASGGGTLSNNVVTWPALTLAKNAATNFTLAVTAPGSGIFTNIAFSTSGTPDSNTNNNNGSSAGSKVRTTVMPVADVAVLLSGPNNVSVGSSFSYTVAVTNAGPSTASNVVVLDNLPNLLTFISATGGGVFSNNVITWPKIISLAVGGSTNFTVTVSVVGAGQFTNVASASSSTMDLDLTNNDGASAASQVQTMAAESDFALLSGAPVFNPQTGLYEESVTVTNIGSNTVAGVRLYVAGLRSGVTLYNATGTTNGTPYVEYDAALDPSNTVTFALEFYDVNRQPFSSTLTAVAILPPNNSTTSSNSVAIIREFMDTRIPGDTRFVIEFATIPGKIYTIIYSDDNGTTWLVATPSITANANITQWYDDGPPKTISKPESVVSRLYRVIQN